MKNYRILILLTIALFCKNLNLNAQQQINYGDFPQPVPSVSSLSTYQEAPIGMATGVPDIKLPITNLSSTNSYVSQNLTLSYNPNNVNDEQFIGEVGLGWTLFSGGVVSRTIVNGLDEMFDNSSAGNYNKNKFDDIYYYMLPTGISGKFKIDRLADDTFYVHNLTANNVRIEFGRTANTATLIVNSFTITDDKGFKYIFNDYSRSLYVSTGKPYMSAFFLTHIKNPNNVQLLNYEYQRENRYINGTSTLLYESCKLKKINSFGIGSIKIDYSFNAALEETMNDSYAITKITTENSYGKIISQYLFEYNYSMFFGKNIRVLTKIKKSDLANLNGSPLESTSFEYNVLPLNTDINLPSDGIYCSANSTVTPYPVDAAVGILKRILLPSGGVKEYIFEPNEYYFNKNDASYLATLSEYVDPSIQYISHNSYFEFNTAVGNLSLWNLSGDPTKKKKLYIQFSAAKNPPSGGPSLDPGDGQSQLSAAFKLDGSIYNYGCNADWSTTYSTFTVSVDLYPGYHTFEMLGYNISGSVYVSELITVPPPYKNIEYTHGVRIKNMRTYLLNTDTNPVDDIYFTYNQFDNPNSSSGEKFYSESSMNDIREYIIYRNVQVKNNNNEQGYTNYTYKTPADYPDTYYEVNGTYNSLKHYLNITSGGLLDEKKAFNSLNQPVNLTKYDYILEDMNGTVGILSNLGYVRPGVIKKVSQTETNYFDNSQSLQSKKETEYANLKGNFQLAKTRIQSPDGDLTEKEMSYPIGLVLQGQTNEYEHLWNANMRGIPVKTIEKRNGKLASSVELKFENGSFYPTSTISNNPFDNSNKTVIKYDRYDDRGNIVQYTTSSDTNPGTGYPTTIIYGYNQSLPILKAEGAKWNDFQFVIMPPDWVGLDTRSNQDIDEASEKLLLKSLDEFRVHSSFKNFLITTYTYDPLVGTTTITPPSGLREIYKYDQNNRLKYLLDVNGNIIKDFKYNTKPQP